MFRPNSINLKNWNFALHSVYFYFTFYYAHVRRQSTVQAMTACVQLPNVLYRVEDLGLCHVVGRFMIFPVGVVYSSTITSVVSYSVLPEVGTAVVLIPISDVLDMGARRENPHHLVVLTRTQTGVTSCHTLAPFKDNSPPDLTKCGLKTYDPTPRQLEMMQSTLLPCNKGPACSSH